MWTKYEPGDSDEYIPIEKWGQDHWSTFAYLETVTVDSKGIIDNRRMRCSPRLHRELANLGPWDELMDGSSHPTRLKDGEITGHDDWSCVEDMIAAGLVEGWFRVRYHDKVFGGNQAKVTFTLKAQEIAAKLRQHKANGGNWSNFEWEVLKVEASENP